MFGSLWNSLFRGVFFEAFLFSFELFLNYLFSFLNSSF
ncbi:hypothetical protein N402_03595 [Helicobacter pylori FD423]|nr:hypothetical protein N402_03595 [Helicobacter pylori FD423]